MSENQTRPVSVPIIGGLFVIAGSLGIVYHALEFHTHGGIEWIGIMLMRLAAIVAGIFLFRGAGWARWLLIGWMMVHVVLSAFHNVPEWIVHSVLLIGIAYFLFYRPASDFFRHTK